MYHIDIGSYAHYVYENYNSSRFLIIFAFLVIEIFKFLYDLWTMQYRPV